MSKLRKAMLLVLMTIGSTTAGAALAQEDSTQEAMHKAHDAMQKAQDTMKQAGQAMQSEAKPAMSAEDQAMMEAWQKAGTPGPEHQSLIEGMVGSWNAKTTMWMQPDAPPMVSTGTAVSTAVLGGRYVRMDFTGEMMGEQFTGIGYSGYDNVTGNYFSTWIDSMTTGFYKAKGTFDPATQTYTYHGKMADPVHPDQPIDIRQTVRVADADHHLMTWYETRDGTERKTMTIEFSRAE